MNPEVWNRSLGDLVAEVPARAAVFDRLGLDYCCHGDRLLSNACAAAGLDAASVSGLIDLARAGNGEGDLPADPVAMVEDILATHHRYLRDELPQLVALAAKVIDVHGGRHRELVQVGALVTALWDALEPHLDDEENVLFPAIRRLMGGERDLLDRAVRDPIWAMGVEHERAGELLDALREASDGYTPPADGCASYQALYGRLADLEADTHLHIHKENNVLFPLVVDLESTGAASH